MSDADLRALIDRQEIHDVLIRYCRGVDRADPELLRSCYHEGAVNLGQQDLDARGEFVEMTVSTLDKLEGVAHHNLTSYFIELDGDVAHVESYCVAFQPYKLDDGSEVLGAVGSRSLDRFERRDGRWAIVMRRTVIDWSRKEIPGENWPHSKHFPKGGRREADPSHEHFGLT
jgi:hypothetical protein